MRKLLACCLIGFLGPLLGCGGLTKSIDKATDQLERGVNSWDDMNKILKETKNNLDNRVYADQVGDVIGRAEMVADIGYKESLDFTRHRVIEDLKNIKLSIQGKKPLQRHPTLTNCQSAIVDFSSASRRSLTFVGWNLDILQENKDKPYQLVIKNKKSVDRNIEWNFVSFQGQYAMTIDVSRSGIPFQHGDYKIVAKGINPAFEISIVNSDPPPLPRITRARVTITSVTDKPRKGQITIKLLPGSKGPISLWLKEEWGPGTEHRYESTCDIPATQDLKIIFMFKGEGPAGGEFAGQRINWTGNAKVELFIDGGATPVLLGQTENRSWKDDLPDGFVGDGEHFAVYTFTVPAILK